MKKENPPTRFWLCFVLAIAAFLPASSYSAQYNPSEYQSLLDVAKRDGYVRVIIGLSRQLIFSVGWDVEVASREMAEKSALMMAELGEHALIGGLGYSPLGQMHAYVNETGLRILAESTIAQSFSDGRHYRSVTVQKSDGSLDAVLQAFRSNSLVEVDLFLNVAVSYSLTRSGETVYHPTPELSAEVQRSIDSLRQQPYADAIEILAVEPSRPVVRARIDRSAFYGLIEDKGLRAVRLPGHQDVRAAQWSEEALTKAEAEGKLQVDLSLRGGDFDSSWTNYLSVAARGHQSAAHRAAFADIFQQAGVVVDMDGLTLAYAETMRKNTGFVIPGLRKPAAMDADHPNMFLERGHMSLTLTSEELAKLYAARDARVLRVTSPSWLSVTTGAGSIGADQSFVTKEMETDISVTPVVPLSPAVHDWGDASLQTVMGEQAPLSDTLEYCFPQLSFSHSNQGPVLEYKQVIAESDLGQRGFVFVAARNKSEPDHWWLLTPYGEWVEFDVSGTSTPDSYLYFGETDIIAPVSIRLGTQSVHGVEIWVGYGLGIDRATAFDSMLDSDRFKKIWESGSAGTSLGLPLVNVNICMTPSKISVDEAYLNTLPSDPSRTGVIYPSAIIR